MTRKPIPRAAAWALSLAVAALVMGCEKRSVTVQSPTGSTTTTTIGQSAAASAELSRAGEAASDAAAKIGEGASRVAERVGTAASSAVSRLGQAASEAATTAEAKAPAVQRSVSGAMSRAGEAIGDAAITAKVKAAYLADADVKGMSIDVDTHDGVVTLNGTLDRRSQADKAESIARRIDGVKAVQNRLTFKGAG